ncbi:MAG: putative integrase [Prokaryotic dsDNA virus sp.]|nr:MAG: putative integrase [Prokaryotic dsDNA virus sp.]|tara:strand:+ start:1076 stop:1918 length:843 start_codon:yes stop_codon:yes gene_type:complete
MSRSKTMSLEELGEKAFQKFWAGSKTPAPHRSNLNKVLEGFGHKRLVHRITSGMIEDQADAWVAEGTSEKTVNRRLSCLSRCLTWAHQRGWLAKVPYISKYKEKPGRLRWQTIEEEAEMIRQLRELGKDDLADLVAVLADTGCRRGELLELEWDDVDGSWIRLWETKGGTARSIPLTKRAQGILEGRRELESVGPFASVDSRHLENGWNKVRKAMGLSEDKGFTPHCLRHGCASRLVQAGVPILTVKELLGHAKIETTLIYAHLAPKNLEEAVRLLEMGR